MSADILFELNLPSGECWTTTPIQSQVVESAIARAKRDGIPIEVVKHNFRTNKDCRNVYYPDGTVCREWKDKTK